MRTLYRATFLAITCLMMVGCATSRQVIALEDTSIANPSEGPALKLFRVSDNRKFQIRPATPSIPSLKNGEIEDTSITSRAIARKRNGYGRALGDILLPEGETVMKLVEDHLTSSLRENGYRVLSPGEADYPDAMPLEIDINQFWGWMSPGAFTIGLSFQADIVVSAPTSEYKSGVVVCSDVEQRFGAALGSNWKTVIEASLEELNINVQTMLNQSPLEVVEEAQALGTT